MHAFWSIRSIPNEDVLVVTQPMSEEEEAAAAEEGNFRRLKRRRRTACGHCCAWQKERVIDTIADAAGRISHSPRHATHFI